MSAFSNPVAEFEVRWYRRFGKYPIYRIRLDSNGGLYLVGDCSWNNSPAMPHEIIEPHIPYHELKGYGR
jgi:hypothetical protein